MHTVLISLFPRNNARTEEELGCSAVTYTDAKDMKSKQDRAGDSRGPQPSYNKIR